MAAQQQQPWNDSLPLKEQPEMAGRRMEALALLGLATEETKGKDRWEWAGSVVYWRRCR